MRRATFVSIPAMIHDTTRADSDDISGVCNDVPQAGYCSRSPSDQVHRHTLHMTPDHTLTHPTVQSLCSPFTWCDIFEINFVTVIAVSPPPNGATVCRISRWHRQRPPPGGQCVYTVLGQFIFRQLFIYGSSRGRVYAFTARIVNVQRTFSIVDRVHRTGGRFHRVHVS
ncbi:19 kDa [Spodoptera frugiperda ascovirus 1a]|uniref:19 kDa n=1 Tax=Spodoptera frugiperda ascovirus 1a TaxID=113370 RepID=Q0E577_SFAVA|nr:19 kDa [Spodoptera frugiperda ascovirus 1a]CAL44624.1 19 kDa [Spodoptera frugiperda ascovirus 1a]